MAQDHWLPGFYFNVEESDAKGQTYETLAICRSLALAGPDLRLLDADAEGADWREVAKVEDRNIQIATRYTALAPDRAELQKIGVSAAN